MAVPYFLMGLVQMAGCTLFSNGIGSDGCILFLNGTGSDGCILFLSGIGSVGCILFKCTKPKSRMNCI